MAKKKAPKNLQLLKGVDKKDPGRINYDEPVSSEIGDPPPHMKLKTMQKIWYEIINDVADGVFQSSDRVALELACALLYEFRKNPIKFPTMKMNRLQSLLSSFGMTPSDRTKITVKGDDDGNPFEGY
jgi:hypothetical protein